MTGSLVNIIVTDLLDNDHQVPIGVAANVCGVAANILVENNTAQPVDCTRSSTQMMPLAFRP